jgi:hypothetical protein
MRIRTIVFLLVFAASGIAFAVDLAGVTQQYILPTSTETVQVFDAVEMKRLPVASSSYSYSIADSPVAVEAGSVLFGNITLCCVGSPSEYTPVLYILASDQMSLWRNRNTGPMYRMADTTILNYTFSGPEGTETLTFRVVVSSSDTYHFVVFAPVREKPILHMSVLTWKVTESMLVKLALLMAAILSLAAAVIDYKFLH